MSFKQSFLANINLKSGRFGTLVFASFALLQSLCTSGCTQEKAVKALQDAEVARNSDVTDLRNRIRTQSAQDLTWQTAVARLQADNAGLKRSRLSLKTAKDEKKELWKGLVPRASLFVGLTTLIGEISDFTFDDVTGQIRANFNIPNPFNFYGALYAADINAISAEWSHELDQRRAVRELYVAFQRAQDLDRQRETIEFERGELANVSLERLTSRIQVNERALQSYKRNYQQSRTSLNRLLGTPGANWRPVGGLPDISYRNKFAKLELGDDIGKLGFKLEAARIELAQLTIARIKLQRWPNINFGLSGPAFYSTSSGSRDFELANFTLFSGLSDSIDLTDPLDRERIQRAEERLEATMAQMNLQLETELVRFDQTKIDYQNALREQRRLQKRLSSLDRSRVRSASQLIENFDDKAGIRDSLFQVEARINRLDLEYWVWDDKAWN